VQSQTINPAGSFHAENFGSKIITGGGAFDHEGDLVVGDLVTCILLVNYDLTYQGATYDDGWHELASYTAEIIEATGDPDDPTATGSYSGQVLSSNGGVVSGASVGIGDLSAFTDASGMWSIPDIPVGEYTMFINADDHQPYADDITVILDTARSKTTTLIYIQVITPPIEDGDDDDADDTTTSSELPVNPYILIGFALAFVVIMLVPQLSAFRLYLMAILGIIALAYLIIASGVI
jgi:hypothetical protein